MPTTSTIAQLAPQVQARLQDPASVFWSEQFETYAGLAEAFSELLLIFGRPTVIFNSPLTLTPTTVWLPLPTNLLALTDIRTTLSRLWKTTLHSLDTSCASWTSAWESDRAAMPARWAPAGLSMFVVHPAPLTPVTVNVTGIQYPVLTPWPPNGTEQSCFHTEIDEALQLYAASYCRIKEVGNDAFEGQTMYQSFLEIGQRLSVIESRRDQLIWTRALGAPTAPSHVSAR